MHLQRTLATCLTTLALVGSILGQAVFPLHNAVLKDNMDAQGHRILNADFSDYAGKGLVWGGSPAKFNVSNGTTTQAPFSGNQNDFSMPGGTGYFQKWSSTIGPVSITGISVGQFDGQQFLIANGGTNDIVLLNDTISINGNRFLSTTGSDITVSGNQEALLTYDSSAQRWRVAPLNGGSGGGGGGSGTVVSIATGPGLAGGPITTSGTINLANLAPQSHKWVNSVAGNVLNLTQPAFTDISGIITPGQLAAGVPATDTAVFGDGAGGTVWKTPSIGAITDPFDPTKQAVFDISGFVTGTVRTIFPATNADSVTIVPAQLGTLFVSPGQDPAIVKGVGTDGSVLYGFQDSTAVTLTNSKNDYNMPSGTGYYQRWTNGTGGSINVTGIGVSQIDGENFLITNVSAQPIVLQHENTASAPGNRLHSVTSADITLAQDQEVSVIFDATKNRWRTSPRGSSSGSGTVTSVATGSGLTGGPVTTTGTIDLANVSATAHNWVDSVVSNVLHFSQPAFTDISGAATNSQLPATLSSKTIDDTNTIATKDGTFTLENTTDTTKKVIWDLSGLSTGITRTVKPAAGGNSVTVLADNGTAHNFFTGISLGGAISKARPVIADLTNLSTTSLLIGSNASSSAVVEITLGSGLTMTGSTLSSSGGGGTPGGSSGQVQWNNSSAFGGISTTTTDGTITTQTSGADFVLSDPSSPTKKATFDLTNITAGQTRSFKIANGASVSILPDPGTAHNFFTAVSAGGAISKAQPDFTDLTGTATNAQVPGTLSSKTLDDTNTYTAKDGSITFENTADTSKKFVFNLANIAASTTRTMNVPNANATFVQADTGASNNFLTAISAQGLISKAQPDFTNLSGIATNGQLPGTLSSKTFDSSNLYIAKDGSFTLDNTSDLTKQAVFDLSNIATGTVRTVNVPNANSTTVQANTGSSNNFVTAISAQGVVSLAQPSFSNIGGTLTLTGDTTGTSSGTSIATTTSNMTAPASITDSTGTTNATVTTLLSQTDSTGTPVIGFGNNWKFQLEDSTTNNTDAGRFSIAWTNATHGAQTAEWSFGAASAGGGVTSNLFNIYGSGGIAVNRDVDPGAGIVDANTGFMVAGTEWPIASNGIPSRTSAYTYSALTAPSGAIVGTSDSQALTNKDLTGSGNTFPTFNQNTTGSAAKLTTARNIGGVAFDGTAAIVPTNISGGNGTTLLGSMPYQSATDTTTQLAPNTTTTKKFLRETGDGTNGTAPAWDTIVSGDVPTLNQNTTGSAASLSVSGQTGLFTVTGLTSTNRAKTVRDAADTILELGGSYTPTGTWTALPLSGPSIAGGLTASGSSSNDFSGSTGTFKTSSGANQLTGAVTIADATTPSLTTASGKTNTGFLQVNGKTSGALKVTAADAAAQTVTLNLAAQTSGAATLTIPDQAGTNRNVVTDTGTQTLTNKTVNGATFDRLRATAGSYTVTMDGANTASTKTCVGSDIMGLVTLTMSSTGNTSASICTMSGFGWAITPTVILIPANASAWSAQNSTKSVTVTNPSATGFDIAAGTVGLVSGTTYTWFYVASQ